MKVRNRVLITLVKGGIRVMTRRARPDRGLLAKTKGSYGGPSRIINWVRPSLQLNSVNSNRVEDSDKQFFPRNYEVEGSTEAVKITNKHGKNRGKMPRRSNCYLGGI